MLLRASPWACLCAIAVFCAPGSAVRAAAQGADGGRAAVDRVLEDYVGLYASSTLDRWKALFHPSLTVASPNSDGTILVRGFDPFVEAQRSYLATDPAIVERLENVRVEMGRRIARASADFILVEEGVEHRGKLGLHLVEGRDGWRIVAIVFAYDAA
jgi:putative lumazine-binding protein